MSLAVLIPAALALAVYAGLALSEAARLSAGDTRTLIATGALIGLFAVGLALRRLWAYAFGLLFLGLSALGYGAAAAFTAYSAFSGGGASGWEGVRTLVIGAVAAAFALACLVALGLALSLLAVCRKMAGGRSLGAWMVSMAVASAGVGFIAWTVAHDYVYRRMPARSDCLAGRGGQCYNVANDRGRLSAVERREFARRGCELWNEGACRQLAELMTPALGAESPEARALSARCLLGKPDRCLELGKHLLSIGDGVNGARYLEKACEVDVQRCVSAARAAREGGQAVLSRRLLERGCDVEDPRSCTGLLREAGPGLGPDDRLRLEMKTCLIGDVNDCRSLMRRDLRSVCPIICEGNTVLRFQSCRSCASEAEKQGEPALARQWRAASCETGDRWSCGELDRRRASPKGAALQTTSWSSVVYAGRAAGAASIRANAALIKPTDKPRLFSLLGVWRYDVPSRAWRRLVTSKRQIQAEIPPQRQLSSQDSDQVLYALPREIGLYWVEWQEDDHQSGALAFSGPVLCNDVMIGEAPKGMIATCVPLADSATAMFVPDPKVATGIAIASLVATTDGSDYGSRAARGIPVSALPEALLAHLEKRGARLLERASDDGTGRTIWVLAEAPAGARCEVFTTFVRFPPGVDAAAARRYLLGVSLPSVLNERERLAMFHPAARGTTSNPADCERWGAERARIVTMLVEAFESYVPAP